MKGSLFRYLGAGVFTSLLDFLLFTFFVAVVRLDYLIANVISTCVTLCVSYLINRRLVFRSEQRSVWGFIAFLSVTLFNGLVVQAVVIWSASQAMTALLPWLSDAAAKSAAKIVAMGVGAGANYLSYRWIFRDAGKKDERADS